MLGPNARALFLATVAVVVHRYGQAVRARPERAAAVAGAPLPRSPRSVEPPGHPAPDTPAVPAPPDPGLSPVPARPPAAATAACVDRELRRRGLNAYGDPQATVYRRVPPVPPSERVERVLARYPEIRTTCAVPRAVP